MSIKDSFDELTKAFPKGIVVSAKQGELPEEYWKLLEKPSDDYLFLEPGTSNSFLNNILSKTIFTTIEGNCYVICPTNNGLDYIIGSAYAGGLSFLSDPLNKIADYIPSAMCSTKDGKDYLMVIENKIIKFSDGSIFKELDFHPTAIYPAIDRDDYLICIEHEKEVKYLSNLEVFITSPINGTIGGICATNDKTKYLIMVKGSNNFFYYSDDLSTHLDYKAPLNGYLSSKAPTIYKNSDINDNHFYYEFKGFDIVKKEDKNNVLDTLNNLKGMIK